MYHAMFVFSLSKYAIDKSLHLVAKKISQDKGNQNLSVTQSAIVAMHQISNRNVVDFTEPFKN